MTETFLTVTPSNSLSKMTSTDRHLHARAVPKQWAFATSFQVSFAESLDLFHPLLLIDD